MTQRNPRPQGSPALLWAGLTLLLLGVLQGHPTTLTGHTWQTVTLVTGQLLLLGTMLSGAARTGRVRPPVLLLLAALLLVSTAAQLWPLWDAWHSAGLP